MGSSRAGYFKQRRLCRPGLSVRGRVCCREARRGARRPASPSAGRGRQLQASRPAQASGQRCGCRELLRGGGVSCCCFSGIGNCSRELSRREMTRAVFTFRLLVCFKLTDRGKQRCLPNAPVLRTSARPARGRSVPFPTSLRGRCHSCLGAFSLHCRCVRKQALPADSAVSCIY